MRVGISRDPSQGGGRVCSENVRCAERKMRGRAVVLSAERASGSRASFLFYYCRSTKLKYCTDARPFRRQRGGRFLRSKRFVFRQYGGGDHPHSGNITEGTVHVRAIFPRSGDLADGQGRRQGSREDENPSNVIERWDIQRRFDIVCFVAVWRKFKTNQQVSRYLNG